MKFYPLLVVLSLVSCGEPLTREDLLPDASGTHGEIILLMEDAVWNSKIGEATMLYLNQDAHGPYLRPEPMFSVVRKRPDELNHLTQLNRNILKVMIDNDSTYAATAVLEKPDYFAKNQLFIIVKDSDPDRLLSYVMNDFNQIVDRFNQFETQQLIREYKQSRHAGINERAQKKFGISIAMPGQTEIRVDSADFMWTMRERSKHLLAGERGGTDETYWIQQGFLFWSEPYRDTTQLTVEGVLRNRDSVLKYHVPGKLKDSYMATEYDSLVLPEARVFTHEDSYAIEVRGIWRHAGNPAAFGGGPFVQYSLHHKSRGTVVTVCGYIYAPKFDKREYIRELDAMLSTIEFVE